MPSPESSIPQLDQKTVIPQEKEPHPRPGRSRTEILGYFGANARRFPWLFTEEYAHILEEIVSQGEKKIVPEDNNNAPRQTSPSEE